MPVKKLIKTESTWKPIRINEDVFASGGASAIEGLIGIEEMHDYNIEIFRDKKSRKKKEKKLNDKLCEKISPVKQKDGKRTTCDKEEPAAKKQKTVKKQKTAKKKKTAQPRSKGWSISEQKEKVDASENDNDLSAWKNLFVEEPVIKALSELGFTEPTQIQTLALPPAIMGKRDILGAAETGSGKTLAFGIPIIQGILNYRERVATGLKEQPSEEVEESVESNSEESEEGEEDLVQDGQVGCVKVVPLGLASKGASTPSSKLHALILTPTRELAIQVKNHLVAATKYCHIKIATVVGGMSQEKQERVLRQGPDIVVATPGRLWELIKEGNTHLQQVDDLRYLVIDEADRMLERGHFQELRDLLERIEMQAGDTKHKRQTLVFSATLTLVHEPPNRLKHNKGKGQKKKPMRQTPGQKLQELITLLGMTKPKVIDVTAEQCTVDKLTEAFIPCALEDKDAHLYCFLQRHPGRTLVFCNSVSCVRRLAQLFTLLQCKPTALHAHMAQRQRLRSLDKFSADPKGLLLATDVAARGLDIPNVQHVIHYQVPRTSESYVHRSGRTARANNEGLTVLLVEPKEMPLYSRLCRTLGRDQELPQFPVDGSVLAAVQERVQAARQLEALEHTQRRSQAEEGWLSKAAKELDLHFDKHDKLPIKGPTSPALNHNILARKKGLIAMLRRPLVQTGRSAKYPTSSGGLQVPFAGVSMQNPIDLMKNVKPNEKKGLGAALGFGQKKKRRVRQKKRKK